MKLSVNHVLFWMDAIRNSNDRYSTLESFWKGQIKSKIWLIENVKKYISNNSTIVIHGGWNGVLASLLFQSEIDIEKIISIDIDPDCEETARTMNKIEEISEKFEAITCNIIDYQYKFPPTLVINTICEHITQETYDIWLDKVPNNSLIALQSNNFYKLSEHQRCAKDLEEFIDQSNIKILVSKTLYLDKYDRFLLIGYKHENN